MGAGLHEGGRFCALTTKMMSELVTSFFLVDQFGHVHARDVVCAHVRMKDCAMVFNYSRVCACALHALRSLLHSL